MATQWQPYQRWNNRQPERHVYASLKAPPWVALLAPHTWPATVHDISTRGVGLILSCRIPPQAKMKIELRSRADGQWHAKTARVAHCTRRDPHTWRVGFDFVEPLTEEELQDLLP